MRFKRLSAEEKSRRDLWRKARHGQLGPLQIGAQSGGWNELSSEEQAALTETNSLAWAKQSQRAAATKRLLIWGVGVYALLWLGGEQSYYYTHKCVRSHQEERYNSAADDVEEVTVCDFYSANGHRWTILGPVRAVLGL